MNTLLADITALFGDFHFLRPLWLLALLPIILLLWQLQRDRHTDSNWHHICDEHLLPYLLVRQGTRDYSLLFALLGLGWIICTLALAGPTWNRQPQPVFRVLDTRIVVLDLSRSMDTPDLKPSRAMRARFKVADMLAQSEDGQIGLIVFAGDAFVVSPITRDADTISNMLPALLPEIMPVQGSRLDLGLQKAGELFAQAGVTRGTVIVIADAGGGEAALEQVRALRAQGFPVSVLAVGTDEGAPIPTEDGDLIKDSDGNIVIPRLDQTGLQALARAGNGYYATIQPDNSDLDRLLQPIDNEMSAASEQVDQQTERWQEMGPWLILPLLPLAALAFRRGWLILLVLSANPFFWPSPAVAWSWNDLWLRTDQQVQQALEQAQPETALQLAADPWQRGTAAYRTGDYQQALEAFSQLDSAPGYYNRGNALTQLGRYDEALSAYDTALAEQPGMQDAKVNRAIVEALKEKQQQQEQQQQSNTDADQEPQSEDDAQQSSQDSSQGSQGQPSEDPQTQNSNQPNEEGSDQSDPGSRDADAGAEGEQPQQDSRQTDQQQDSREQSEQEAEQVEVTETEGEALSEEERQIMEQWLRRIPDDPAGLLRRKFLYQYQRRQAQSAGGEQTW